MSIMPDNHAANKAAVPGSVEIEITPDSCGWLTIEPTGDPHNEGKIDSDTPDSLFIQSEESITQLWADVMEGDTLEAEADSGWSVITLIGIDMFGSYCECFS